MSRLLREDWLPEAQRLAVGRKHRIFHKPDGSRRANLVIGHEGDRWWAYCQACKTGDAVHKEHVKLTERAPAESTKVETPHDIVSVHDLEPMRRRQLEGFLLGKGVAGFNLPPWGYSASRKRLIIRPESWQDTIGACLGRDITGASPIKWIVYNRPERAWVVEPIRHDRLSARGTLYITEDLLSMYKVRWALNHEFRGVPWNDTYIGTTLGTGITSSMLAELVRHPFNRIVVFYDGDKAGVKGAKTVAHRLQALLPTTVVSHTTAPDGFDPKDMEVRDIINHLRYNGGGTL